MTTIVGRNTLASEELRGYVERIENLEKQKKQLGEDIKLVKQEATSRGFIAKGINYLIRIRKKKPHDLQEDEEIAHLYRHALGMDSEPPLFRQIQAMARDVAGGEKLLEAFKLLVPPEGEIIITIAGKRIRVWRDKDGEPQSADYTPPQAAASSQNRVAPRPKPEVPDCNGDEAYAMGQAAAKANIPVIDNPFPFGDERRPRWDEGWRHGAGNDGMGGGQS
jgi:uncharacterized protein (UPF0335 family)